MVSTTYNLNNVELDAKQLWISESDQKKLISTANEKLEKVE